MTVGGFLFGVILMIIGFLAVWKTEWFLRWLGDISDLFGAVGLRWLSWKILGIVLIVLGFLTAFGLFGPLITLTVGRFFSFGRLGG